MRNVHRFITKVCLFLALLKKLGDDDGGSQSIISTVDGCYRIRINDWPHIIYECLRLSLLRSLIAINNHLKWTLDISVRSQSVHPKLEWNQRWAIRERGRDKRKAHAHATHRKNADEHQCVWNHSILFIYNVMLINATLWILELPHTDLRLI